MGGPSPTTAEAYDKTGHPIRVNDYMIYALRDRGTSSAPIAKVLSVELGRRPDKTIGPIVRAETYDFQYGSKGEPYLVARRNPIYHPERYWVVPQELFDRYMQRFIRDGKGEDNPT